MSRHTNAEKGILQSILRAVPRSQLAESGVGESVYQDRSLRIAQFQLTRGRNFFKNLGKSRLAFTTLAGAAGLCLLLGLNELRQKGVSQNEIDFRKRQIVQPIHDLNGEERVSFPWARSGALESWLYRPVRITGRPNHSQAIMVPRTVNNYEGFDYIVPLITKENEDGTVASGVLVNKGWIPKENRRPANRFKIENSDPQEFVGVVSRNVELEEHGFLEGNSPADGRNKWTHVYLPDMAKTTHFENQRDVKAALIECVELNTPLDEKNPRTHALSMTHSEDYPFVKTRSGILQQRKMPWDHTALAGNYFTIAVATGALALLSKIL